MIRVGVIGCGYWGPNLVRNFAQLEGCDLIAVADTDSRKLNLIHKLYPAFQTYASGEELIKNSGADAVAIATPVASHYALAKAALESGKHVLLEKPMTATVSQAEELNRLAKTLGKVLMVDHTFVFSGAVRKIHELIQSGELGEIYYYDAVRVNLGLFQHDVDVLWDLGPHDLSIMAHLLGKQPRTISAIGARPVRHGKWQLESIAYITIRFSDETIAHLHLNWLSPVKIRRTLIGGSRKMIVYDHLDPDNQVKVFNKGIDLNADQDRSETLVQYRIGDMVAPKVDQTEALEAVCQHFMDSIRHRRTPITDGEAGLQVVKLLAAAAQSLKQHGEPVSL